MAVRHLGLSVPSQGPPGPGISSLQALSTALASTIGTGSIAGVAAAIYLGGPGAVFWMWVSALLGMATSCVEKLLAVRYHCPSPDGGWQGGPMYYLRDGLHCPVLAAWFALACLPATLAGGNLIQSGSIASALHAALGWDRLAVGLGTALLAGLILTGGMGRVARVAQRLVPAMALLYLGSGLAVLLLRREQLPRALALIFSSALSLPPPWAAARAIPCSPPCATGWPAGYSPTRLGWAPPPWPTEPHRWTTPPARGCGGSSRCSALPWWCAPSPPWSSWSAEPTTRRRPWHSFKQGWSQTPLWASPSPPGLSPPSWGPPGPGRCPSA